MPNHPLNGNTDPHRMLNDLRALIDVLDRRLAQVQEEGAGTPDLLANLQDLRKRTLALVDQIVAGLPPS